MEPTDWKRPDGDLSPETYKFKEVIFVTVTLSCGHMFNDEGSHHWKIGQHVVACPQCNRLKV